MTLHVLYSPQHLDFVRDAAGKPVVTEKPSPTRGDAPTDVPHGCHWMAVTDEDDSTVLQPNSPVAVRGEPTIVMRGQRSQALSAAAQMKKQYILWNSATGALAKRGNKFVLHDGAQPPTWDNYPRHFPTSAGWKFEEVCEVIVDPKHSGPATYIRTDSQVARFSKIIAREDK